MSKSTDCSVLIRSVASFLPPTCLSNDQLIKKTGIESNHEWIQSRTGIESRHVADPGTEPSDLALGASMKALDRAGIDPKDLSFIIVATSTADYGGFPSCAAVLQEKLGAPQVMAFDVSAACTGFNYALSCGEALLKANTAFTHGLIVAADCLSKVVDWKDRKTCVLFGDGAGAAVISKTHEVNTGILSASIHCDGSHASVLTINPGDKETNHGNPFVEMNGRAVYKVAVEKISSLIPEELAKNRLQIEDIKMVIFHQANLRIIQAIQERFKLKDEQVFSNIQKYGNTSAASIPIAITEACEKNLIKKGDLVLLVGFGAGFTWGSQLVKWAY